MRTDNTSNLNISAPLFDAAEESSTSPSAKRAKTEEAPQASSSGPSAAVYTGKSARKALLQEFQNYSYQSQIVSGMQSVHNRNFVMVHEKVEECIENFIAENPNATPVQARAEISRNMGQILMDAKLDTSCYQVFGDRKAEYGKHLIFSSLSIPFLKDAPLCFQLFHFEPGQTTPIHNHPNPTEDPSKPVLVECASYVVDGMVNERLYARLDGDQAGSARAEKTHKEFRDAGSRRVMDNPGTNPPHSIKNSGNQAANTVHAYTMDGISEGQRIAVQDKFEDTKSPSRAVYQAYNTFIENGHEDVEKIAAQDLLSALKANKFGADPVIVDIRKSKEVQKRGALHVEGVNMLHAPRGLAVATILQDFPDKNTHLILSCSDGARAALLAHELQALGYSSTVLTDGARGCKEQGLTRACDMNAVPADKWRAVLNETPPALTAHIEQLKSKVAAITPEDLAKCDTQNTVVVFDVRQENERSGGVIPNAQRVPAGDFEKKAGFHAHDLNTPVVIYSGGDGDYRALVAAKNLMEMGYSNVRYLAGGYQRP